MELLEISQTTQGAGNATSLGLNTAQLKKTWIVQKKTLKKDGSCMHLPTHWEPKLLGHESGPAYPDIDERNSLWKDRNPLKVVLKKDRNPFKSGLKKG